jgi:hypothetical protein
MKRRKISALGFVYRGQTVVGPMRLEASVLPTGVLVGTIRHWPVAEYPLGHAVSEPLVMRGPDEPPMWMCLPDGTVAVFHIGSRHGTLVNGRCVSRPPQSSTPTAEAARLVVASTPTA